MGHSDGSKQVPRLQTQLELRHGFRLVMEEHCCPSAVETTTREKVANVNENFIVILMQFVVFFTFDVVPIL